jgi:hypothetical protein
MDDPFRQPIEALHARIEALQTEVAQLRERTPEPSDAPATRRATRAAVAFLALALVLGLVLGTRLLDVRDENAKLHAELAQTQEELAARVQKPSQQEEPRPLGSAAVVVAYHAAFGREPTDAEVASWTGRVLEPADLQRELASTEEGSERIQGLCMSFLGRRVGPDELARWTEVVATRSFFALHTEIASSPEAESKRGVTKPNCDPPWDAHGERRAGCPGPLK